LVEKHVSDIFYCLIWTTSLNTLTLRQFSKTLMHKIVFQRQVVFFCFTQRFSLHIYIVVLTKLNKGTLKNEKNLVGWKTFTEYNRRKYIQTKQLWKLILLTTFVGQMWSFEQPWFYQCWNLFSHICWKCTKLSCSHLVQVCVHIYKDFVFTNLENLDFCIVKNASNINHVIFEQILNFESSSKLTGIFCTKSYFLLIAVLIHQL